MSAILLYKYPKGRHKRTQAPPAFSKYKDFRPYLVAEFSNTCVYCRTPDVIPGSRSFAVEHYLPKRHFRSLETQYTNLFLACHTCNGRKGQYFPQTASDLFIPNPCDHVMFDHLRYDGSTAKSHSVNGQFAIERLLLNDSQNVQKREIVATLAVAVQEKRDEFRQMVVHLEKLALRGNKSAAAKLPLASRKADMLAAAVDRFG